MATTTYGSPYVSGSDLVAGWPAASLTVADAIDAAGYYVGRGINTQTASYTGVLTDGGKTVTMSNAGATTVTIPPNSSVAYPTGTRINILNLGAGACTPTAGAGVTISGTISALATNQGAAVVKTATNTWSYLPFTSGTPVLTSSDVSSTTGSPTITTSGIYTIYKFTGSGTIVLGKAGLCDALLVGGGGGAGAPGAGAGGYLDLPTTYLPSGTLTVTVGAGGTGNTANVPVNAIMGVSSRLHTFYALGGGGIGGDYALVGGSGSGAWTSNTGGSGVPGQGNNGGNGATSLTGSGGGGGGASAVGANGNSVSSGTGGVGGAGTANSITGSSVTYAGGGGGGGNTAGAAGGAGGGGAGTYSSTPTAGTVNTGGGGGGKGLNSQGAAGGSGIVIVRVVT